MKKELKEPPELDCRVCDVYYRVHHTEAGHGEAESDCGHCEKTRREHHATHHSLCWDCGQDMTNSLRDLYICQQCKLSSHLTAGSFYGPKYVTQSFSITRFHYDLNYLKYSSSSLVLFQK